MKTHKTAPVLFGIFTLFVLNTAWLSPAVSADEGALTIGGSAFALTIPNKTPPPTNAPEGMVWIPGGEFSMGCKVPSEGVCTTPTAQPVPLNDYFQWWRYVKGANWRTRTGAFSYANSVIARRSGKS